MRTEIPIIVLNPAGVPIAGASVFVVYRGTTNPVVVYSGEVGAVQRLNPLTTDSVGRVSGWVERGAYDCIISATGLTTYTEPWDATPATDGSIDAAWIGDGAVISVKLADNAVVAGKIADAAVGEAEIADLAVTGGKLGPGAVTSDKIAPGAVTPPMGLIIALGG